MRTLRSETKNTTTIVSLKGQLIELMAYSKSLGTTCCNVRLEKDALAAKTKAQDLQIAEMKKAVYEEHSLGFEKALRQIPYLLNVSIDGVGFDVKKDIYQGKLVPLKNIPDEEFEAEVPAKEVVGDVVAEGQVAEEGASREAIINEEEVANETGGQDEATNPSSKENINPTINVID